MLPWCKALVIVNNIVLDNVVDLNEKYSKN
ncbi:MAG: hypothetical protein Faunusvirus8_25 [Faunusvirus sp.]|uniref:Uncharacterized protein n=1 Tax=Faunusvirus sp. TaxID=2487766 RepID=A0A3G4ZWM0_9VIRU|nr:MAG: hypothetical protein Faunusvirus8_25 [Faunusvirus sp.]